MTDASGQLSQGVRTKTFSAAALVFGFSGLSLPLLAAPLPSRRNEIVDVVQKVSPAVVNIAAEQTVRRARSVFDEFFFGMDRRPAKSLGSGVIINAKGIILTND